MRLLHQPEGGSLNDLVLSESGVTKTYGRHPGDLHARGHDKLRREYFFLTELPPDVAGYFARVTAFQDQRDPRVTLLTVERHPERAIAKAILLGDHDADRTRTLCALATDVLLDRLYPLRARAMTAQTIWERHHLHRMRTAIDRLGTVADIAPMLDVKHLRVNDTLCPSVPTCLDWLCVHWGEYFTDATAVAAHGDAHLDNILGSSTGVPHVRFVDPRGDLYLEPSYDFAKLLKAARTRYDPIHYGFRTVTLSSTSDLRVRLDVDPTWDPHYAAVLALLIERAPEYAHAQRVSLDTFWRTALVTEFAHVVSFAFYHANRPRGRDLDRVRAYLAVASLLGQALLTAGPDRLPDVTRPIFTE